MTAVRQLHRGEAPLPDEGRRLLLQPGGRPRGRHHPRTPRGPQAQARLRNLLGNRSAAHRPRRVQASSTRCWIRTWSWAASYVPSDGLASAARAVQLLIEQVHGSRGAVPRATRPVTGIEQSGGQVTGVQTPRRRGHPGGHRGLLRRLLGPADRRDDRHVACRCCRWPTSTSRPTPVPELDGHEPRAQRGLPADPAPPGPGPLLPRARRPDRHRLLRPPPHARGPGRPGQGAAPSSMSEHQMPSRLEFTVEDFLPCLGGHRSSCCPALRGSDDRRRLQRHLLLHPRRRPAGRPGARA